MEEIKQYLNRYKLLNLEIWSKIEEVKELKDLSTAIKSFDYSKDKVQSSINNEALFERYILKAIEIEKEYLEEIDRLFEIKNEIEKEIDTLESDQDKIILKLKYINNLTISQIAEKLEKTTEWTSKLHTRALRILLNKKLIQ